MVYFEENIFFGEWKDFLVSILVLMDGVLRVGKNVRMRPKKKEFQSLF